MVNAYSLIDDRIVIERELTDLDIFVRDFLDVLKKHQDYLIVSGFVSISTGRTRGTEDVDILVNEMSDEKFKLLFEDLQKAGFWCYQGDSPEEAYKYLNSSNIRFARKDEMFPNMEFISINESKKAKWFEFTNPQILEIKNGEESFIFKIPMLEFEISYKENVLKSEKDIEDAKHLRELFKDILKQENFDKSMEAIQNEIRN